MRGFVRKSLHTEQADQLSEEGDMRNWRSGKTFHNNALFYLLA